MRNTRGSRPFTHTLATVAALLILASATVAAAGSDGGPVVLRFEPTAMLAPTAPAGWPSNSPWPPNGTNASVNGLGATGYMVINQSNGHTELKFSIRGARPNTLYTIWTVFKPLVWCTDAADLTAGCPGAFYGASGWSTKPGMGPNPAGFYSEGGPVAPTASLAKAFTNGMGLDPGATFYTNQNGNGEINVNLDYNILGTTTDDGPPVGNSSQVQQCAISSVVSGAVVPGVPTTYTAKTCPQVTITLKNGIAVTTTPTFTITSSWLRKFILQVADPGDPLNGCANYDPTDPASAFWQCIDPATVDPKTGNGLPRVWRFPFDHFRLAAHPDELTHGFIGGSGFEHTIDMVGRRCALDDSCPK